MIGECGGRESEDGFAGAGRHFLEPADIVLEAGWLATNLAMNFCRKVVAPRAYAAA
jgi:hypothetical protein